MQIIVSRTKSFIQGSEVVTISPAPGIQVVPDWVGETTTFALGVQDGSVKEVEVKTEAPEPAAVDPAPDPAPAKPNPQRLPPPPGLSRSANK